MEDDNLELKTDTQEKSLWQQAQTMNKFNFVSSLEGKSRFLWVLSAILILLCVVLFFVIPEAPREIEKIAISDNYITTIWNNENTFSKTKGEEHE